MFSAAPALGWLYHEHRAITAKGVQALDPRHRAALDAFWTQQRGASAARLCASPAAEDAGAEVTCIDFADWPAIAGDHSCTPQEMLRTILESAWILNVKRAALRTGERIGKAVRDSERRNYQAMGDLGLESADPAYSTRAGSNNAHFLLPRESVSLDPTAYTATMLRDGSELNAAAIFVAYHLAALHQAALAAGSAAAPEDRAAELRIILALEAFALHFLEDAFAAGHVAGSWGEVAERKGTHDYYNEHGVDAENWDREPMQIFGDGHMREDDLARAGHAVETSLEELLDALQPDSPISRDARGFAVTQALAAGSFDVCKELQVPHWQPPESMAGYVSRTLRLAPIPFRGPGFASLPRFRAEIGSFIGAESGAALAGAGGGFTNGQSGGVQGALDVGVRVGLGLDALLGDAGDGLIFIQAGITAQTRSSGRCEQNCPEDPLVQQFVPAVPARSGLNFRLRIPFWLIPGDLVLATPVLAFTNPMALKKMAIRAADGGLIPWQTRLSTRFGAFQFMAGREVAVTLFGFGEKDAFLGVFDTPEGRVLQPIAVKSLQWEFPLVEYRPFREYGSRFTFSTFLQLGFGLDQPLSAVVVGQPNTPSPSLQTRYFGFLRIFFDGRRYF
jgi:hypothetical protein